MNYEVYTNAPFDFQPTVEVASCYCEHKDAFLLLKRNPNRPQGTTWGVPAGKLEKGETPRQAVVREVFEEVGIEISIDDLHLIELGKLYIRLPHLDYVYHMFLKRFQLEPSIKLLLEEHTEACWVTVSQALEYPLIAGGKEALEYYIDKSQRF